MTRRLKTELYNSRLKPELYSHVIMKLSPIRDSFIPELFGKSIGDYQLPFPSPFRLPPSPDNISPRLNRYGIHRLTG